MKVGYHRTYGVVGHLCLSFGHMASNHGRSAPNADSAECAGLADFVNGVGTSHRASGCGTRDESA